MPKILPHRPRYRRKTPTSTPPPPTVDAIPTKEGNGIWQFTGNQSNNQRSVTSNHTTSHLSHTFVDCINASQMRGFWISERWENIQPNNSSEFVRTFINAEIAHAENTSLWWDGKRKAVGIRIIMGEYAPAWALADDVAVCTPTGELETPVPWHGDYPARAALFQQQICEQFDSEETVVVIYISQVGSNDYEMALIDDSPRADGTTLVNQTVWQNPDLWTPDDTGNGYVEDTYAQLCKDAIENAATYAENTWLYFPGNRLGFTAGSQGFNQNVYNSVATWLRDQTFRSRIMLGWTEFDHDRGDGQNLVNVVLNTLPDLTVTCWDMGFTPQHNPETMEQSFFEDAFDYLTTNLQPLVWTAGPGDNKNANDHTWISGLDQTLMEGDPI